MLAVSRNQFVLCVERYLHGVVEHYILRGRGGRKRGEEREKGREGREKERWLGERGKERREKARWLGEGGRERREEKRWLGERGRERRERREVVRGGRGETEGRKRGS